LEKNKKFCGFVFGSYPEVITSTSKEKKYKF